MEESTKTELSERFARLFPNCTLFAVHLDGFSHDVFYKDADGVKHIDGYSAYAPEQYEAEHKCYSPRGDYAIKSWNEDRTKALFLGYGHLAYQNNARELCFKPVSQW